ncbi:uncharacterized protein MONOS_7990 [Monocercomonoides exilis]|uniref:uncharacterized protein n=1 Tax=Monocercomonoides exilis TaxID=2049356 RepID=UPI003559A893|nr:hypothetical protein MONOS_7990 [Monocercomonoides exilis]|eukprot:MONOS_7990.1-p1 / transcript=MONOS_7990.1 / gene=MONOS_7990 / organism=Monocercomonoides_exilis_PA203 / gene_product=unspecified product / transcript_product=unspecified product / location=Mono_scaffold00289:63951-64583(+) / protein_length=193 / sequence_SO=supercontig / SO=protein_coding / is_pseudo=false
MSSYNADERTGAILEMSRIEKFSEIFSELESCNKDAQKQKIQETNEIIDEMDEDEIRSTFTTELFDKMGKMIKEKKLSMENAIVLLKHVGYYKVLLNLWNSAFHSSLLRRRFEKMIIEEDQKKKKEKNEKLLADLCECYTMLHNYYISREELLSICVPCLLKVAVKKEEDEVTQKEVEMALLALTCLREGIV